MLIYFVHQILQVPELLTRKKFIGQNYNLVQKKREKRPLLYQLGQLLLFLHIFVKDHGNGAPQHLTGGRMPNTQT